ncbi:MAG: IS3 family transposase [Gemmatimonadales bacterium]
MASPPSSRANSNTTARRTIATPPQAQAYRQWYRLLRRDGRRINRKRVQRLYQQEGRQVRRRRRKRRVAVPRTPRVVPTQANERWSMDFIRDTLGDGRVFRALTIVDDCTRECPAIEIDFSLSAERVVRVLDRLAHTRGLPRGIVCDNGPEFAGQVLDQWAHRRGIGLDFIEPGKLVQNAFIESFNGTLREECLNENWFVSLADAQRTIDAWRVDYQHERPHSSLGDRTPEEFALTLKTADLVSTTATGLTEKPDQL